ncbi:tRNA (adenine(37)-N6)-methyltransferase isoform X2 [Phyllobates terribilis]|uniref:tRNA (adenine(37)-N6)-methyltransferase isoform X2 n=1 Tax=Phyllobates terribilis TaxID=111132 RepID=UPI003CCAB514
MKQRGQELHLTKGYCAKQGCGVGNVLTQPIGYIESCFTGKNGTPRQPSICSLSRGSLRISKKVFNNPEHSLMGLQQFSHLWILFIFHKNGHLSCKAKVQPPRLNGAKTGVFSTRSPHRPNAIGLTLAKLDKVEGDTIHLSGIDMIQGTPVIDIKPYIAEYDSPRSTVSPTEYLQEDDGDVSSAVLQTNGSEQQQETTVQAENRSLLGMDDTSADKYAISDIKQEIFEGVAAIETAKEPFLAASSQQAISPKQLVEDIKTLRPSEDLPYDGSGSLSNASDKPITGDSFVPKWVTDSPVPNLTVRFTAHSEKELRRFKSPCELGEPSFRFFQSFEEAKYAIVKVLSADPRSVYRRNHCLDRLFYFSLDTIHITVWFGDGFAEVLQIQPVAEQAKP